MFNSSILKRYDIDGMHQIYDRWPELAQEYYDMTYDKCEYKNIDHVIFAGMGGSGTMGNVLSAILSQSKIHLCVVKGFHLPKTADSNTLVIATSASGDTLETLHVLDKANKAGCKLIAFSSGGKMQKYCIKNKIGFAQIPVLNSPRASFPMYLYSILNVLDPILLIKKTDVIESIKSLKKTQKKISSSNLNNNPSIDLASWLSDIPVIYYPWGLQSSAIRFKNSLQENAKMHAFAEDIMEACHNGIVSWERPSKVKPILIQGKDDYIKTKELWKVVKEYFKSNNIEYRDIYSVNGNVLSKIVNLIYLLDYSTIYCAVMKKVNPTPTRSIDFIKKRMV